MATDTRRQLIAALAVVIVLILFSGCLTTSPGQSKSGTSQNFGPSSAANPPSAYDTPSAYGTPQAPAYGTTGGSCRQGLTSCSGNCVDTSADIGNCGGCRMECPSNAACNGGQCYCKSGYSATAGGECSPATAPTSETTKSGQTTQYSCEDHPGMTPCDDGYCWYLTEREHCGSCSNSCSVTQACINGQCVDQKSQSVSPAPVQDVTTATAGGTCGVRKEGTICKQTGGPDLCVNLKVSNSHCGKCSNPPCPAGTACVDGQCQHTICTNGKTQCSGLCTSLEFPTLVPNHCGGCGQWCPKGNICREGVCEALVCPAGRHLCGDYFCCPAGKENPCADDPTLKYMFPGSTWCDKSCRNLTLDPSNCGSCGHSCSSGQKCCNGKCTNVQTDAKNCGSCGNTCSSGTCSSGKCVQQFAIITTTKSILQQQLTPKWNGQWTAHTTYDFDMNLVQSGSSVTGTYAGGQGRITSGTVSGNGYVLSGTSSWNNGPGLHFQFTMATDGQSFTGSYSDASGSHPWNGHR